MRVKVVTETFISVSELNEGLAYLFVSDKSQSLEEVVKGFLFPVDVKALKLLGINNALKFSYSRLPTIIKSDLIPRCINHSIYTDYFEVKPVLPSKRINIEIPSLPEEVFQIARREGISIYLVGGGVRDLLLGRNGGHRFRNNPEEWDFVVMEGFDTFQKILQKRFKAKHFTYPSFFTASLILKNGERIDLSKPRFEFYSPPGKVFHIQQVPLYLDLLRRDFTINSMALSVRDGEKRLIDIWGGLEDLEKGILRLVRPYAFLEDPLRILRMIRYAITLGFNPGEKEEIFLSEALEETPKTNTSYLDPRFGRELMLLLASSPHYLKRFIDRYYFLSLISPSLKEVNGELIAKTATLFDILTLKEKVRWEEFLILLLLSYLQKDEALNLLQSLNINIKGLNVRGILSFNVKEKEFFLRKASYNILPYIFVLYLARSSLYTEEAMEKLKLFLKNLVNTEDLKRMGITPGPKFSIIIRDIKIKTLEGKINNRDEALTYLKNNWGRF